MEILQVTYDAIDDGIAQSIQSATSALLTLQRGRSLQLSKHVTKAVAAPGVNEVCMVWSRFVLFIFIYFRNGLFIAICQHVYVVM